MTDIATSDIRIPAAEGGAFDCHIAGPEGGSHPALVIMASIFGVDDDVRGIAADLAAKGVIVAAPDLFWRTDPGPKDRSDEGRAAADARSSGTPGTLEKNLQDLKDTMAALRAMPGCNGRIAVAGLCWGGPFALLGPARAGCDAGFSFHGTDVQDHLDVLAEIGTAPVRLHWGTEDHACPPEALARVREAAAGMENVSIVTYDGVRHGYTAPGNPKSWNAEAAADSWSAALAVMDTLRDRAEAAPQAG